jgi:cyanate permease
MTPGAPQQRGNDSRDEGLDRGVKILAVVVVLGVIMSILDTTIVNVALDKLSRDLHSSLSTIQWVSTGYLLSLAMVIPLAGWLSERFGSKRVWMVSVAVFAAGSALCGIAWSAGSLIFFRVLQGFGGGLILPVGMSVLAQTESPTFPLTWPGRPGAPLRQITRRTAIIEAPAAQRDTEATRYAAGGLGSVTRSQEMTRRGHSASVGQASREA